ncbi:MAG: hypothetical protein RL477_852 [Pseudomonadota bacterium]|jgi:hypothetical protein
MSLAKSLAVPAILAALAASAVPVSTVRADEESHSGGMQMAQGGPGSGGPGQMMQGERGPRAEGDRAQRREQAMKRMADRRIQFLDANKDGKISAAEIAAEEKRLFAAADVNGDGKLSVEEFRRRGQWFVRMGTSSFFDLLDANGDGQISAEEMTGPSARWFKRHDADKNGTIDADEYVRARESGRGAGGHGRHR